MTRPTWICFDLNGTLVDPRGLTGDDRGIDLLDTVVLQAMTDTITGRWRPFAEYVEAALRTVGVETPGEMPAFDDAAAALRTVRDAGYRVAVVTNSSQASADGTLRSAGLYGLVEEVVGAEDVGAYKPDRRVYDNAAAYLCEEPSSLCLAAAHSWDCMGAVQAGWQAAWVGHREPRPLATTPSLLAAEPTLLLLAERLSVM